tara:strand:- start:765 stop:941 length:177 start_codon:yes stop_codon:yes gene_type:complete
MENPFIPLFGKDHKKLSPSKKAYLRIIAALVLPILVTTLLFAKRKSNQNSYAIERNLL